MHETLSSQMQYNTIISDIRLTATTNSCTVNRDQTKH